MDNNKKLTACFRELERVQTQLQLKASQEDLHDACQKLADNDYVNEQLSLLVTRQELDDCLQNKLGANDYQMHLSEFQKRMNSKQLIMRDEL